MFRGYKPVKARNTGKRHQPIVAQPSSIRRVQLPTPGYVWCSTHLGANSCSPRMRSTICYACLLRAYHLCAWWTSFANIVIYIYIYIASTIPLYSNELVKSRGGIIEHIRYPPIFVRAIILFHRFVRWI